MLHTFVVIKIVETQFVKIVWFAIVTAIKCELTGCEEDTYWNECIFGDEVLVSYNSCFENFLKDFAIEKS
jgi:hypothetical protein